LRGGLTLPGGWTGGLAAADLFATVFFVDFLAVPTATADRLAAAAAGLRRAGLAAVDASERCRDVLDDTKNLSIARSGHGQGPCCQTAASPVCQIRWDEPRLRGAAVTRPP